ncbi:alpha/beta fold hydrolase [Flavobacterium laiguense]|uniref:Hydrolase n=1 Tax=Flavobacterium laiguense TaxID=2169409 RepID=A0A2U1JPG3_9FLAO|nr:alpha/beta hydrolase [Flavobacterium laiguense]PWA06728.1 hydrolase [Flavobacterium laiguense]
MKNIIYTAIFGFLFTIQIAKGQNKNSTTYHTIKINGTEIFYREAGNKNAPTLVLLHGYPTSSFQYRNLIDNLSDKYHLIAPDYPGYGRSEQPAMANFAYTFENISTIMEKLIDTLGVQKYSLYLMDYGAPIGFRIAEKNPTKIESLIIQNGNAYDEGLETFWEPFKKYWKNVNDKETEKTLAGFHSMDGLKWQYMHGVHNATLISNDNWEMDMRHLSRPENNAIQLAMFYDYQSNVKLYPKWQAYFRKYQPKTLIVWGKNDYIFPASGAEAYKKDLKNIDFHLYDTGHFALESYSDEMAIAIRSFLNNINHK